MKSKLKKIITITALLFLTISIVIIYKMNHITFHDVEVEYKIRYLLGKDNDEPISKADLSQLKKETHLVIDNCSDIQDIIKYMPNLKMLDIGYTGDDDILSSIYSGLPQLEELRLSYTGTDLNLDSLSKFKHLKTLWLDSELLKSIHDPASLHELESLVYVGCTKIKQEDDLSILSELPDLEELNLYGDINLDSLSKFKHLKQLHITSDCIRINDPTSLRRLDSLVSVDCGDWGYSFDHVCQGDDILSILSELPKLESLSLMYDDTLNLDSLSKFKHLKTLYISSNQVSINNFTSLKELESLESVRCYGIRQCDFTFLNNIPNLKNLELHNCNIADISIIKNTDQLDIFVID